MQTLNSVETETLDLGLLLQTLSAVKKGDFSVRMPIHHTGLAGKIVDTLNEIIELNDKMAREFARINRVVGKEGKISQRASIGAVDGKWNACIDSVNTLITDLVQPTAETARVIRAVARGDLSQRIALEIEGRPLKGEFLQTAKIANTMVDQLNSFASEVTRVAREVGTEGKLGGQAEVEGVAGTWKDLTDNVNLMASNLTNQVRNIAEVSTAIANGDLSKKITVDVKGEILDLKNTINTMVDQLNSFASEVTRVAREVGTEGNLGGQAVVKGVAGTWKDLTDNVNLMAGNLTNQVRNIAEVSTAIANGDLSKKITVDVKGEILDLKNTINTMVDQLNSFASEVTRVAREVGTEGNLGGQAVVKGVAGTWKDLTDNVNSMASNLTNQVRNIAEVSTAIANGDLSKKITVDVKGEILDLKNTLNTMVDQLNSFAAEVTRVAREVGTEGKLGGQAEVEGVAGTWKDLTDNVNLMASNLTNQVRNIAEVSTAIANGDLSKKITVDVKGEILDLKNTLNTMVDQLNSFAAEVTRVAREVGTEGKLGGQAEVEGVAGTWKDLTDNVNLMASNLTNQVRNIAEVSTAIANGDLSKKITVDVKGEILDLKNTLNTMVDQLNSFAAEVTRVAREVGTEGKLGGQAEVEGVAGTWKDLTDNVNLMASNLTNQVRNIAEVSTAIAKGDLSKKITVDVKGEILDLKNTLNTMVDQLNSFASEVTRVAREVGTEGKLGGQAEVEGVAGTWKDLTDNVNLMASNLTEQVRGIARVVTAVANGDLKQKLALGAKGEIATLADTINEMIDTLATFADQVTTVAREVGIEGKLGGQATVPSAAGTWKHLTDNVNQLAANLTTQVRAIAEVATAVTKGDLTRSITGEVELRGEVAELKDNINQMIANLRETTQKNAEQDWLKTNLAKISRMLQGQRELESVSRQILGELTPLVSAQHGAFYLVDTEGPQPVLRLISSYAYNDRKPPSTTFRLGESLVGQCALEKERILVTDVPENYIAISSGLGEAAPLSLVVLPILFEGQVSAVIELASFHRFSEIHLTFLDQLTESIGIVLNTIDANMRTEKLLAQSQSLTEELQNQQRELTETNQRLEQQARSLQMSEDLLRTRQEELRKSNEELEEKARLLELQNSEVERKNHEIEQAKEALEEKAEQLALSSRYKSEFLANMSHELRTPLNSMLILSKLLADNPEKNLTHKQVEFAQTIHLSGVDLLALINDILDLTKIESGNMSLEFGELIFTRLREDVDRAFRQVAQDRKLEFQIKFEADLPYSIHTDGRRLQQILRNLLSNAFKFTEQGKVMLHVEAVTSRWTFGHEMLRRAHRVIAFHVIDTGIGIPLEKQKIIFEAFQQADGTTSRKYGGTGLGLSISRELAQVLGGEIHVVSQPGTGSTFTLFLPENHISVQEKFDGDTTRAMTHSSLQQPYFNRATMSSLPSLLQPEVSDDRHEIDEGDRVILVIEDDVAFAHILYDVAHDNGFKALVALRGDTGLALAREYEPDAITLDIQMAEIDGWLVLDQLKHDPQLRHIPVHLISVVDDQRRGLELGAFANLQKPVTKDELNHALARVRELIDRPTRTLLLVEDVPDQREQILETIQENDVDIISVNTGEAALTAVRQQSFDAIVLDLDLPDMSGFELIERICGVQETWRSPFILFTSKNLTKREEATLKRIAKTVAVKNAHTMEQLLNETIMFLHRVETSLSPEKRRILEEYHSAGSILAEKKVLIVDDDIRNIFALTSVLEEHRMQVRYAETGQAGIDLLQANPEVDVVLMDIMMPGMDGYETIRTIRKMPQFAMLPIIAVTAKAMKGDREKCIDAGASNYITKPVNTEHLLSMLRVLLKQV